MSGISVDAAQARTSPARVWTVPSDDVRAAEAVPVPPAAAPTPSGAKPPIDPQLRELQRRIRAQGEDPLRKKLDAQLGNRIERGLAGVLPPGGIAELFRPELERVVRAYASRANMVANRIAHLEGDPQRRSAQMGQLEDAIDRFVNGDLTGHPAVRGKSGEELLGELGLIRNPTIDAIREHGIGIDDLRNPESPFALFQRGPIDRVNAFSAARREPIPPESANMVRQLFPGANLAREMISVHDPSFNGIAFYDAAAGAPLFNRANMEAFNRARGVEVLTPEGTIANELVHDAMEKEFGDEAFLVDASSLLGAKTDAFLKAHPEFGPDVPSNLQVNEFLSDAVTASRDKNFMLGFFGGERDGNYDLSAKVMRGYLRSVGFSAGELDQVERAGTFLDRRRVLGDLASKHGLGGYDALAEGHGRFAMAEARAVLEIIRTTRGP
jgi:hypothetical protein